MQAHQFTKYTELNKMFLRYWLTPADSRPTIRLMSDNTEKLDKLELQVNDLLQLCQKLSDENRDLRAQITQLNRERSTLVEQKETVRTQVESMITRLRSMENA